MTLEEVGNLTPEQIRRLIERLAKDFNWRVSLAMLPVSGKLDDDVYPLNPDLKKRIRKGEKIDRNNGRSLDDFINELNSL